MRSHRDIDHLLEEIVTLPSLPSVVTRIIGLLDQPTVSLEEVGRVISTDPSLALKTLRLTNSAHYGLRERVTSVECAVALLGEKVVRNLVFTATAFDTLKQGADALLRHSITCGLAMEVLVEGSDLDISLRSDEAFVYGLLHDVGKVVFTGFLSEEYAVALSLMRERQIPAYEAERETMGVDHAELGARLAREWRLPEELVDAIAGHHDPGQCRVSSAVGRAALLSAADYVCFACGIMGEPGAVISVGDQAWGQAGLRSENLPAVMERFFAAMPTIDEFIATAA